MMKNQFDPYLLAVLSSRIDSITQEMVNTVLRTARSQVLNFGRDFSVAIMDSQGRVIATPDAIPIHCGNMGLMARYLFQHPDGIRPGDLFLNNSPYHGNSHAADYTYFAPVYFEDTLMFFAAIKVHQADCGCSKPTTYYAWAKDVYDEGSVIWPFVKIQSNYSDVPDIINIAKMRIRVPEIWYGDYLASLGAVRVGEKQLGKLCREYGIDLIRKFCEAYSTYARRRMQEEIQKLSDVHAVREFDFDAVPGISETLRIHIEGYVDRQRNQIVIDVTKNPDHMDWGLNMPESTTIAACKGGVMFHFPDIPSIDGALDCIRVEMREGAIMSPARHPVSYAACTTNLAAAVAGNVGLMFNQIKRDTGMAEPNRNMPISLSVVTGYDHRRNNNPFANQVLLGSTGGPGVKGHDGWINFCDAGNGGAARWNSVELLEKQYPFLVKHEEIEMDMLGSGQFDAAPSCRTEFMPLKNPVTFAFSCDGYKTAPSGAAGGLPGSLNTGYVYALDHPEHRTPLSPYGIQVVHVGEVIAGQCCSGGGYGDPLQRDPTLVCHRVREGWISKAYAEKIYGVVIQDSSELYCVDEAATRQCRSLRMSQREGGSTPWQ